jgi:SNF2 family DNA or RNA helicase
MKYFIKPWDHQLEAIDKSLTTRDLALFWEMGTGKTATTINILRHKYNEYGAVVPTIILAPIVVLENWASEFETHAGPDYKKHVTVIKGTAKKKKELMKAAVTKGTGIIIMNYECMQSGELVAMLYDFMPRIMVCDESQRLKSPQSKRARAVFNIARSCKHRYILSGTPILNSPQDIFMQFKILDGGETFGNNFFVFRNKYFYDKNAGMPKHAHFPNWIPRAGALNEISKAISTKALRKTKDECLDLPPLIREKVFVELSADQKRAYKEMRDDFYTTIRDSKAEGRERAAVADLAITKGLRLQQIVSGFINTEDGTEHTFSNTPRIKALTDLLRDLCSSSKVIVWATFKHNYGDIRRVCDELGLGYTELHGGVKKKDDAIKRFRTDKDCRVIIANAASAGIGVNLIEAAYSIYFSKSFRLEDDVQSEARNHRGGSEVHSKITRIDLVARDTIDEQVTEALEKKLNIAEAILDWKV